MNCCGGYLNHYGDYSAQSEFFGGWADLGCENSQLVVLFGNNPAKRG